MRFTKAKYHGRAAHKFEDWIIARKAKGRGYTIWRDGTRVGSASSLQAAKNEVKRRNRPERVKPRRATVAKDRCAPRGKQSYRERNRMPDKAFALPRLRQYPLYRMSGGKLIPSGSHAANAKARARQQLRAGNLTQRQYLTIVAKADRVLKQCGGRGGKAGESTKLSAAIRRAK